MRARDRGRSGNPSRPTRWRSSATAKPVQLPETEDANAPDPGADGGDTGPSGLGARGHPGGDRRVRDLPAHPSFLDRPDLFIAPAGALVASAGGVAVGAAYAELVPHLPRRPWTAIALIVVIGVVLFPAFVIAELRGPIFAIEGDGGGTFLVPGAEAVVDVVVGLLGSATIAGGGLGWLIAGNRRAAGTTALAAFAFALGPGHNIPLLGGTPAVAKELAFLAAVVGVASVVLVEAHAWLMRLQPAPTNRSGPRS